MATAAEKLKKKDMASGDSVAETLRPLADGLQENWKTILPVAGISLAVLLIVAIVLEVQSHHREQAAQSVGDALAVVDRQVVAPGEPGDEAVPAPAKGAPTAPKKPDAKAAAKDAEKAKEEFASEVEKQNAIAKQAQVTIDQFGSQPAGRVALLTLGDAQYRLGKFPDSAATYQKFIAETPDTDYLKAFGQVGLAWALLGNGKGEDALAAAKTLSDHPPAGFGKDLGLLAQGQIAEDLGKLDVAKQAYKQLRAEAGESAAGRQANERLTYLGEPPVVPTPTEPAPLPSP